MILLTKLHSPPVTDNIVPRPRLYARLDRGLQCPLTLVSAPAGFGKSTLLSAWLAQSNVPYVWLSLDEGDNDLAVFVAYFVAAVRKLYVDACPESDAFAHLAAPPEGTLLAHQLINELEQLPGIFVLVLDDFHTIHDSAIHQLIATILHRPPQSLRLVLATRQDPHLPLARMRGQGRLFELGPGELRFRRDETVDFLGRVPNLNLDETGVAIVDEAIEGWAAGLRLATIRLQMSRDRAAALASLASNQAYAAEYLFGEVLTGLPQDRLECLLRLAVVDRFCADLCDAICELPGSESTWPGGQAFIGWLMAANLFLLPLDDEGKWYRFHQVFLQILRQRLHARYDTTARTELLGKAAAWFAEAGHFEESIHYFIAAGDLDAAADVVIRSWTHVVNREDWQRLMRWLDLFPVDYFERTPGLWIIKAWILHTQFRLAQVEMLLDRIDVFVGQDRAQMSALDARVLTGQVAVLRSQNHYWRGEGAKSVALASLALECLPAEHTYLRAGAHLYIGLAMQMIGEQTNAMRHLMRALAEDEARRNNRYAVRLWFALMFTQWFAADLNGTERSARQILKLAAQRQLLVSEAWANLFLGNMCYWRNELAEAAHHFGAVVERPYGAHKLAAVYGHCGLALTYAVQGRDVDGAEVLQAAYDHAALSGSEALLRYTQAFDAHLALIQGKRAAAIAWADQDPDTRPSLPMLLMSVPQLTRACIRIAERTETSLARAAVDLADMRNFVTETYNTIRLIDVLALEALLHAAGGDRPASLASLQQALSLAEPRGIIRPFVDLVPDMAALLREPGGQGMSSNYVGRLLAAFPNEGLRQSVADALPREAKNGALIEPLTNRELDVLALLGERLSDKEIAEILVVSPVTVKTHARHLYEKLQVSNRREAVARARALGVLQIS